MGISVLLPTYNNSKYIYQSVCSILNQTYKDFELLIIDDGSSDNTVQIIKSIKDSRIRLICHEKNLGLGETLNQGLQISGYPLVARMDGDDISMPDRFKCQLEYLRIHPDVDVLSSKYAVLIGNKIRYVVNTSEHHDKIREKLVLHSEINHSGLIYKKDIILKYGGYKNIYIEDYELWLRLKDKIVFGNVQKVLLIKRYHDNAISQQLENKNRSAYVLTEQYYNNLEHEFGLKNINVYKGWREYFYGDKKTARFYFNKLNLRILINPRILSAYLTTFLSEKNFKAFKELRLRLRINYALKFFRKEFTNLRNFLKDFLNQSA
jgi:glycosyltransferase involved in cell wall biosynthesis